MDASARLTTLTRLGFAARGMLYIVIAFLVIRSGRTEDPAGALDYLAEGSGRMLVMVMAAGFIGYGIWRLSDATFNIENHPPDGKGLRERLGAAASGVVHLALAWQAIRLIRGAGAADEGGAQESARTALAIPGGELALVLVGIGLIGVGVFQMIKAARARFLNKLEPQVAGQAWAKWTGRLGYAARGLVFLICGFFVLRAGLDAKASKAGGFEDALSWLSNPWDVIIAAGLLCFGIFSLIQARFRILHDVPVEGIASGAVTPTLS